MKKKIWLGVLIIIGLFIITGCGKEEKRKETFYELSYEEPQGYTSISDLGTEENKIKNYIYGDLDGSISINYQKGKDYQEVETLYSNEHTEETIDGITWRVMDDESAGVTSRFYYTVQGNDLYLIELNGFDKYKKEMEEFIKNVSFK